MNISKFRGDLSPQRPVRACHGAALALALAGCASPLSFTPPQANAAASQANAAASQANALATIQPQGGAMIPVGFYLDNYTNASVPFYSTVSCGMNPLDVKRGMLTSQQSLWIGGFWSGCLLGINPGYVTIHVGLQSQQCSFVIQANESGWFKSVGSDCQVMFLPKGPFKRGRDGGQMFQNLIYGGSAGRSNSTAPLAASRALRPAPSQGARIRLSGKSDGPNILVENQWSSTIHYSTTVDGNCQPWIPANGTVVAGGHEMMNGQPRYACGAQISFGPASTAAAGGAQACILHWAGDLFLLQQGASTACYFSVDAAGITFYYRSERLSSQPSRDYEMETK